MIHLFSLGYDDKDLVNFEISMANPSVIEEMQRLESWRAKFEVASSATSQEGLADKNFIYKKIFKLTDEEIEAIEEGKKKDALLDSEVEKIKTGQMDQQQMAGQEQPVAEPTGTEQPAEEQPPAEQPIGEPAEQPEGQPITAGKDPNLQRAMPNELSPKTNKAAKKKEKVINGKSLQNHVYNTKKNALSDPGDIATLKRLITSPFGEAEEIEDEEDVEERVFRKRVGQIQKQMEEMDRIPALKDARLKNSKKSIIKG